MVARTAMDTATTASMATGGDVIRAPCPLLYNFYINSISVKQKVPNKYNEEV